MEDDAYSRIVELEEALRDALAGNPSPGERYLAMRALGGVGERRQVCAPFALHAVPEFALEVAIAIYQTHAVATLIELSHPDDWFFASLELNRAQSCGALQRELLWGVDQGAPMAAERFTLPVHRVRPGDALQLRLRCRPGAQLTSVAIHGYPIDDNA